MCLKIQLPDGFGIKPRFRRHRHPSGGGVFHTRLNKRQACRGIQFFVGKKGFKNKNDFVTVFSLVTKNVLRYAEPTSDFDLNAELFGKLTLQRLFGGFTKFNSAAGQAKKLLVFHTVNASRSEEHTSELQSP